MSEQPTNKTCTLQHESFNVKRHYEIHSAKYDCHKGESRKKS